MSYPDYFSLFRVSRPFQVAFRVSPVRPRPSLSQGPRTVSFLRTGLPRTVSSLHTDPRPVPVFLWSGHVGRSVRAVPLSGADVEYKYLN